MNESPNILKVGCLDPGTDTLGASLLTLDLTNGERGCPFSHTFQAAPWIDPIGFTSQFQGARYARLERHSIALREFFTEHRPHIIVTEAPFLGRFPQSYAALLDCIAMVRATVEDYDPTMPLEFVDPPSAKKAVGVNPKGAQKDDIRRAVLKLPIRWGKGIDPCLLSEHAIDSIAVGWWRINKFLGLPY